MLRLVLILIAMLCASQTPAAAQERNELAALDQQVAQLFRAGKYAAAIEIAQRALVVAEAKFGPDHRRVGINLNNLAMLYRARGRYAEAEPLYKRSLSIYVKALGPDHPSFGTILNNLAGLYQRQGRYAEAEPLYKRSLSIYKKALGPDHPDVGGSLNDLAVVYQSQGRYAEAEPLFKRSLSIREAALGPDHPDVGGSLNNLAVLYRAQGRYAEAEPLFKRSLSIREAALGRDHPDVGISLNNLAVLYQRQGRYAEAEPLFKRTITIWEKALGPDHPNVGGGLNDLAGLYQSQGRTAEAERLYKRTITIWEKALGPDNHKVGTGLNNLARLYLSQGRTAEAERLYKRALSIFEKALGPDHPDVGAILNNLAGLYQRQGRTAEAEPLYKRIFAIYDKALGPDHLDVGVSLNDFAWLALAGRNFTGAAERWRSATALLQRRAKRGLGGVIGGSINREAQRYSSFFDGLVKSTYRFGASGRVEVHRHAADMFETAQWGVGSEAAAALAQTAARSAGGSPELAALVRERQDLVGEWAVRDKQLIAAKSTPPARRDAAQEADLATRLMAIDQRLAAIDATLAREFPDYAALSEPTPVSVTDVQASLREDEALVLFLDTDGRFPKLPEETFIWVVTKTEVRWLRSELGTASLQREVSALRCGLDATAWYGDGTLKCVDLLELPLERVPKRGDPLPFDTSRAHALYTSLLGKAEDLIKGKQLLVVPSGALTKLPFQVLVTAPPKPDELLKDTAWLARKHAITVLPSVSSLKALRRVAKPSQADRPMIGFGNPLLDGRDATSERARRARAFRKCRETVFERVASLVGLRGGVQPVPTRGGLVDIAHLRQQTPLPETADELCAVARDLGADVRELRLGANATETEIKRLNANGDLARYRIMHFATHGTLAGQLSGTSEPGLILTPPDEATKEDDGYLSGSEIASLKLDADWVILSACNTAGGDDKTNAEALSGLARVFFYAGARALLVSHWEVYSDATVKLITRSVRAISDGSIGRAEALRRAMLDMMDNGAPRDAHPSYWAPFVVVGEGAPAVQQ